MTDNSPGYVIRGGADGRERLRVLSRIVRPTTLSLLDRVGLEAEPGFAFEMEVLVRAAGTVVERDELSRRVLGRRASSFDRSLDVHLSNLRRKLGHRSDGGERIKTIRGVGYQYVRPAQ